MSDREILKTLLAGRPLRISVAPDVAIERLVVGMMSWFNREMKICAPREVVQWLHHARVAPAHYQQVWRSMWALQERLGGLTTATQMNDLVCMGIAIGVIPNLED